MRPLLTILAAGLLLTLIFAWPTMVTARLVTDAWRGAAVGFETVWPPRDPRSLDRDLVAGGRIERARGLWADRFRILPGADGLPEQPAPAWPGRPDLLPSTVAGPPPADEARRWGRIDTDLCGFPFRCFVGEAWYAARSWALPPNEVEIEPVPESRSSVELGESRGERLALPIRPIWPGLVANVLFWSAATWVGFAIPRSVRSRRPAVSGSDQDRLHPLHQPEMLYQNAYVWFILVSALDVMLTWKILEKGGEEVNPVAREVIGLWGLQGAILFKFATVVWVVIACELVGRRRPVTGRRLAWTAVAVSATPVVYSLGLLLDHLVLRPVG